MRQDCTAPVGIAYAAAAIPGQCDLGEKAGVCHVAREVVEQMVALSFAISVQELRAPTRRCAPVALARQVAMYLLHVACGLSLTEVGNLCGRDRTTVAHACCVVEDRRDDAGFDKSLAKLEIAVERIIQAFLRFQGRAAV